MFHQLLLLLVYTFVFSVILPGFYGTDLEPYALFLFCGLLPWTWFSSSMLESANVLIIYGNLIKKIRFPIEVLPIMVVFTNMIHFALGLPILVLFYIVFAKALTPWVLFLPVAGPPRCPAGVQACLPPAHPAEGPRRSGAPYPGGSQTL